MKERKSDRIWDFEGDEDIAAIVTVAQRKGGISDGKSFGFEG